MATPEQQIAQQRASIEQAKARARQIAKTRTTKGELLKQTLAGRIKKQIEQKKKTGISQTELSKISKSEKEFESRVSKYELEKATYDKSIADKAAYNKAVSMYNRGIASGWLTMSKESRKKYKDVIKYLREFEKKGEIDAQSPKSKSTTQAPGTYDPSTGSYIPPLGSKEGPMSMSPEFVPPGTKIIGETPVQALQRITTPKFDTSAQAQFYEKFVQPKFEAYQSETQRYKDLGYSQSESKKLAMASVERGGVSFTPEYAKEIIKPSFKERVKDVGKGVVALNVASWGGGGITPLAEVVSESGIIEKGLTGHSKEEYKKIVDLPNKISIDYENLEKKWKDKIKGNEFIGTEEEYKEYNKDLEKIEKDIKEYKVFGGTISDEGYIKAPTITLGSGFGLKGREVPITQFGGLFSDTGIPPLDVVRKVGGAWDIGAKQMFFVGGEVLGKAIGEERKFVVAEERLIPEETLKGIYKPQFGTATEFDPMTGRATAKFEDITIKARTRPEISFTGKEYGEAIGDITGFGATTAKYVVPVAGGLFYAGEVGGSIKESGGVGKWIKEKPLEAALTGTIILGGAAFAGTKYLKAPITVKTARGFKITTRADELLGARVRVSKRGVSLLPSERYLKQVTREVVRKPQVSFLEVGQKTIKGEEVIQRTYPVIVEEPAIIKETTLFSEAGKKRFGETVSKIVDIKYKQPKITATFADKPIVGDRGFILRTQRVGKTGKLGEPKYTFVKQESKFTPFEEVSKLDKVQQYTLLKTLEKGKLGGTPIKEKEILKFLTEEEQVQMGISKELGITKPIGKQTSTFQKAAIVKEVKPIGEIQVFDVMVGSKDISKTYPRAVGDVGLIKGKYLELPPIDKTPKDVTTIIAEEGRRTPLSSTFELQKVQALKYIPKKITAPKVSKPTIGLEISQTSQEGLPYMVGGTGLQTTPYAGTGMYEVQEVSAIQLPSVMQQQFIEVKQTELQKTSPLSISKFKPIIKEEVKSMLDIKSTQNVLQPQKEAIKENQLFKQILQVKQAQQLKLSQQLKQAQRLKQVQKIEPIKIKVPFKLSDAISKATKMAKEKPEKFSIFVTKFGKEVEIGVRKTKKEAEELLKKELFGTLRAGGGIKLEGKKLKAEEIKLGIGFAKSKIDPFKVIEKKERRLKRGTQEVPELLFFKSRKKGLKKKKSIFGL